MKTGVIILASALTAVACTNSEDRATQDRATRPGSSATSGGGAGATNPAGTRDSARPASDNNPALADHTKQADNTGINERDRQPSTTPLDQGSSAAETNITASIRKGIMADDRLSFNGKNVKVITVGSKVTLRGPVQNDQAKLAIANIATRTAGVSEVDNQLEVKN